MSELQHILQWVTMTKDENNEIKIIHQFDGENQKNIKEMLELADKNELDVLIGIPVDHKIGADMPIGDPFIAVDMKTGSFNVNGTNWNFMPHGIDPLIVKFRPIWFHSVKKDYAATGQTLEHLGSSITLYKIGWQFTYEEKNYQRILFFNVQTGEFSLKERR